MSEITVEGLGKSFGAVEIFRDVTFRLEKKEKAGLVGGNGEGKTTLMRCLLGQEEYDAGRIKTGDGVTIGYAAQGAATGEGSLWEHLAAPCRDLFAIHDKLEELRKLVAEEKDQAKLEILLKQYTVLESDYEHRGGYSYEQEIKKVAYGLGFSNEDFSRPAASFSGGQKTRILLAGALLGQPDFLFLDEPTNHLDISMTEWLENYLAAYRGGLLVISHDRYFLDHTVGRILQLEDGALKAYRGNYSHYARQKKEEDAARQVAYEKQQEHIEKTEEYIRRYKAGIKSKQARGRESQLSRLERITAPKASAVFKLPLPEPPPCAEKMLLLEDLAVGYQGKELLQGMDLLLRQGEKVALVGANGLGKTTLLKTIVGKLPPVKGTARLGSRVMVGYFSQEHEGLFGDALLLEEVMGGFGLSETRARTLLGGMLFQGDDVLKKLSDLSGGERARLALLKLLLGGANFLVLDEPTNHLDIKAREVVEDALYEWPGSILAVSHDRYFLDKLSGRVWEVDGGRIWDYGGNYSYYRARKEEHLREEEKRLPVSAKTVAPSARNREKTGKRSPQDIEKRLSAVELSLREQDVLLKVLEKRLADPAEHGELAKSRALAEEYEHLKNIVEGLIIEWETLLEEQEKM